MLQAKPIRDCANARAFESRSANSLMAASRIAPRVSTNAVARPFGADAPAAHGRFQFAVFAMFMANTIVKKAPRVMADGYRDDLSLSAATKLGG